VSSPAKFIAQPAYYFGDTPLGGFVELVEPRALRKSESDGFPGVTAKYEHRDLLGSVSSGTLRLTVDPARGVDYEVDLPDTTAGNDVAVLAARKDLTGSSWAFQTYDCDWTSGENGVPVRHLTDVRIIDVSCVAQPAYPDSTLTTRDWREVSVALRSLAFQYDADPDEIFDMARNNRLSKLFVNTGRPKPGLGRRTRPTISGREALLRTMAMALDPATGRPYGKPLTPQQEAVNAMARKTSHQKVVETMGIRWPQ